MPAFSHEVNHLFCAMTDGSSLPGSRPEPFRYAFGVTGMDFITTGVIASTVYDVLRHGLKLSADILKERLGQWIKEDVVAEAVATELKKLGINDELSEVAINRRLEQSPGISTLIRDINANAVVVVPSTITTVTQTHNGSGDNVAGNKIV